MYDYKTIIAGFIGKTFERPSVTIMISMTHEIFFMVTSAQMFAELR